MLNKLTNGDYVMDAGEFLRIYIYSYLEAYDFNRIDELIGATRERKFLHWVHHECNNPDACEQIMKRSVSIELAKELADDYTTYILTDEGNYYGR